MNTIGKNKMYGRIMPVLALQIAIFAGCSSVKPISDEALIPENSIKIDEQKPLTLELAVELALHHDPGIRAARHLVSASYWAKVKDSLPSNPSLSFSVDPTEWVAALAGNVNDLIDLGGQRRKRVDVAQSLEEQAALDVMQRQLEVAREVRMLYAEVLVLRRIEDLQMRKQKIFEQVFGLARQKLEIGEIANLDLIAVERSLVPARMATADATSARKRSEGRLNRYLGRPLAATPNLEDEFALKHNFQMDDAVLDLGKVFRPEQAKIMLRIAEYEARLSLARIEWIPEVEGGLYIKNEDANYGGGLAAITLPIFDRGQAKSARARAVLTALEAELAAVQAELLLEIHDALLAVNREEERIAREIPALVGTAEAEWSLTSQMQIMGEMSKMEVLLAEVRVLEARIESQNATFAWWQARIELAAGLGEAPQLITERSR